MKPIVAIVGRPNVGKSTLFNRIVGRRKAITLDSAGVTRDRHYAAASWEGRDFLCVDTGGLILEGKQSLAKKVREQIELAMQEASVLLFVLDGQEGLLPQEREMAALLRRSGKKIFFVINKIDIPRHEEKLSDFYTLGGEVYPVSSEHGYRVNDLLDRVVTTFPSIKNQPEPVEGVEGEAPSGFARGGDSPACRGRWPSFRGPEGADGDASPYKRPIRVALIGRPNVGKSSLLNRLLGEERVIVDAEPGTTRDRIDTLLRIDPKEYLLIDTAGIRRRGQSASQPERHSILHALKAIDQADICLLVLDAAEGIHKQDAHVAGSASDAKKGIILLWNKWDLIKQARSAENKFLEQVDTQLKFLSHSPVLFLSAKTGKGCEAIWPTVDRLYEACGRRFKTAKVNEVFESLIQSQNPPIFAGKPVKFFYATQTKTFPPTFIVFVSEPKGVHFSFQRYLVNGFRKILGFDGAPIEIHFRKKR